MNPDDVSRSCDDGAHERCPDCACGCHTDSSPALGAAREDTAPGAGEGAWSAGAGSQP